MRFAPLRRRACLGLLFAAVAAPIRAEDALAALLRDFAAVRSSRATFSETKAIPELDLPLPSEGTLSWQAPDRLEKRTTSPIQEILQVAGNRLTYERPDRGIHESFDLADQPELRAMVEAVRGTLAGDLPALQRVYEISFEGNATPGAPWRMVLVPRSLRLRAPVQRIVLGGRGAQVLALDIEGNGGVTRMRVSPAS